jgi:spermidine synthase
MGSVLPQSHIDVVEIDPAILQVAKTYFGYRPGTQTAVTIQDARVFVKRAQRAGRKYDLVLLDAFDHQYIPEHLLTREYLGEVRSILRPGGVLAANTFSISRLYDSESVTYAQEYGRFYNLKSGNRVILVANGPLPDMPGISARALQLAADLDPLNAARSVLLARFSTDVDWNTSARVLTDQYSPANLLNSGE